MKQVDVPWKRTKLDMACEMDKLTWLQKRALFAAFGTRTLNGLYVDHHEGDSYSYIYFRWMDTGDYYWSKITRRGKVVAREWLGRDTNFPELSAYCGFGELFFVPKD